MAGRLQRAVLASSLARADPSAVVLDLLLFTSLMASHYGRRADVVLSRLRAIDASALAWLARVEAG